MMSQAKQYKRHGSMDPGHGCEKVVPLCCCCHVVCDKFLSLVVLCEKVVPLYYVLCDKFLSLDVMLCIVISSFLFSSCS